MRYAPAGMRQWLENAKTERAAKAAQTLLCAVYLVSTLGRIIRKAFLVRGFASALSLLHSLCACVHIDLSAGGTYLLDTKRERIAAPRLHTATSDRLAAALLET